MINEAIDKINKEIAEIKNPYGEQLGTYIITDLLDDESNAEKVLAEKKTLKGCYESIRGKAKESAVGGCAIVDDQTVYGWLREYYGIGAVSGKQEAVKTVPVQQTETKILSLADFL